MIFGKGNKVWHNKYKVVSKHRNVQLYKPVILDTKFVLCLYLHFFASKELQEQTLELMIEQYSKRGAGALLAPPPQFLANEVTLFQPGGQIMSTIVLQAPTPGFSDHATAL